MQGRCIPSSGMNMSIGGRDRRIGKPDPKRSGEEVDKALVRLVGHITDFNTNLHRLAG